MNNQSGVSEIRQNAIWYYSVDGNSKDPLTSAAIAHLYEIGRIKDNTILWRQGFPDWKPIWLFIKGGPVFSSVTTNAAYSHTPSKGTILIIIASVILILGCAYGYFRFLAKTPLVGGWQGKNIFGVTNEVMLFDKGKCWICDADDEPHCVNYLAIKSGNSSYKVTLCGKNRFIVLFISFADDNTIQVSVSNLTNVVKMTRIDKATAKSMMGID